MTDIRVKDLTEATIPGADYYLLTDSATDGVKKVKTTNVIAKADIGLGNVDNTSDVNKPISTATQTALNGKQPLDATLTTLSGKAETGTGSIVLATAPVLVAPQLQPSTFPVGAGSLGYNSLQVNFGDGTNNHILASLDQAQTLTNKTISGASNTLSNIGNSSLTNSSITIAGHSVSLGGSQAIGIGDLSAIADGTITSNISGASAAPAANGISAVLDKLLGTTQGCVVYRGASSWAALGPGTSGQVLATGGPAANPSWTAAGAGNMLTATYDPAGVAADAFDSANTKFEPSGAAAQLSVASILSERVRVESYIAAGATDFSSAIRAAAAAVASNGKGVLVFKHGQTYEVYSDATAAAQTTIGGVAQYSPLVNWNGIGSVAIEGNGAILHSAALDSTLTAYRAHMFWLENVDGVTVEDLSYAQNVVTLNEAAAARMFTLGGGSKHINLRRCAMTGGAGLLHVTASTNAASYGISDGGAECIDAEDITTTHVYYPMNFQFGGNYVDARRIKTRNAGRSYFPYNVHHHHIQLDSEQGGPFDDCLLKVYTNNTTNEENSLYAINLDYRTDGRYPGSGAANSYSGAIAFEIQQNDATSRAGAIKDISIQLDVQNRSTDNFASLIRFNKFDVNSNPDTTARVHQISNIDVRGRVRSWNGTPGAFFSKPTPGIADSWAGDVLFDWRFHDLDINGSAAADFNIAGDGFTGPVSFERIVSSGSLNFTSFSSKYRRIGDGISFSNFTRDNFATSGLSYERFGKYTRIFGKVSVAAGNSSVTTTLPGGVSLYSWLKITVTPVTAPSAGTPVAYPLTATTFGVNSAGSTAATDYYVDIIGLEAA